METVTKELTKACPFFSENINRPNNCHFNSLFANKKTIIQTNIKIHVKIINVKILRYRKQEKN